VHTPQGGTEVHAQNHAGLMRFERAHDRNHSRSSALAGKLVPDVFNHLRPVSVPASLYRLHPWSRLVKGVCAVKTHHDSKDGGDRATSGAVAENKLPTGRR